MTPTEALAKTNAEHDWFAHDDHLEDARDIEAGLFKRGFKIVPIASRCRQQCCATIEELEQAAEAVDREAAGHVEAGDVPTSPHRPSAASPPGEHELVRQLNPDFRPSAAVAPDKVPTGPFYRTAAEIEQAVEAVDREAAGKSSPSGEALGSAAVAPLDEERVETAFRWTAGFVEMEHPTPKGGYGHVVGFHIDRPEDFRPAAKAFAAAYLEAATKEGSDA